MQAAYAQKNGCETVDCGTGAEAGSGLGSKGTPALGAQQSGAPTPWGCPRGRAAADGVASFRCNYSWLL